MNRIHEFSYRTLSIYLNSSITFFFTLIVANELNLRDFSIFSYSSIIAYSFSSLIKSRYLFHFFREEDKLDLLDYLNIVKKRFLVLSVALFCFEFIIFNFLKLEFTEISLWYIFSINILMFDLLLNSLQLAQRSREAIVINILLLCCFGIFTIVAIPVDNGNDWMSSGSVFKWIIGMNLLNLYFFTKRGKASLRDLRIRGNSILMWESVLAQIFFNFYTFGMILLSPDTYSLVRLSFIFFGTLSVLTMSAFSQEIMKIYSVNGSRRFSLFKGMLLIGIVFYLNFFLFKLAFNPLEKFTTYSFEEVEKFALGTFFSILVLYFQQLGFFEMERKFTARLLVFWRLVVYLQSYGMPLLMIFLFGFEYFNLIMIVVFILNICSLLIVIKGSENV